MNTDIALDNDPTSSTYRDIYLSSTGDLATVDGREAILQNILQTIGVFRGEWFLDVTIGIDYFGQILIKNPVISKVNAILIDKIMNVAGVISLNTYSFSSDFVRRQFAVSFNVTTTQGIVNYAGLI
jgi:hypothetical protein